ncbi:hypothetical protein [Sphingomonas cavernae]|uniref:Uncharacterized protein n=1 Tax=Sphingomonas cavernae TaxID=2320861 RepID=A0A418WPR0_9SPHN|nr:hypothetical protein [Sphingomonas cavernae]RJF93215.1 hypothetical protein D3876_02320 [Sphingomonas cavernae]
MAERPRSARLSEICAPWLVPGLALSAASAVPLSSPTGTVSDGRARTTAKASVEIREAARITVPRPGDGRADERRDMPAMIQRPCRPGDAPEATACTLHIIDLP